MMISAFISNWARTGNWKAYVEPVELQLQERSYHSHAEEMIMSCEEGE